MGYILLLLSILLFGTAFWLWYLSHENVGSFAVKTSLSPEQEVITYSKLVTSDLIYILGKAALLGKALVPLLLILLVLVIFAGLLFYVYINGYWIALIIILIFSALVFSISRWLKLRQTVSITISKSSDEITVHNLTYKDATALADLLLGEQKVKEEVRWVKKYSGSLKFSGNAILPKQVYVNDSLSISLELKPEFELPTDIEEEFTIQDKESSKSVTLRIRQNATQQQFLEIELQAAAFTVDGEKKQKHLLNFENPHSLSFQWNCFCPNSGTHSIALIFRVVCSSDIIKLGEIKQDIKVVRVDHLTQRQVGIIASGTTIIGCVSTVIGIVMNFPTLLHIFGLH